MYPSHKCPARERGGRRRRPTQRGQPNDATEDCHSGDNSGELVRQAWGSQRARSITPAQTAFPCHPSSESHQQLPASFVQGGPSCTPRRALPLASPRTHGAPSASKTTTSAYDCHLRTWPHMEQADREMNLRNPLTARSTICAAGRHRRV